MTTTRINRKRYTRLWRLPATTIAVFAAISLASGCTPTPQDQDDSHGTLILSVIGTNDVHGQLLAVGSDRGLALFAGYVNNLRAARNADGGTVLIIDAGDMWQGTLESNLAEGAAVVEAFNEIGYSAAAIGNHEFDFGPAGSMAIPESEMDDAQGALKQRAIEADFPLLAANLIDSSTGEPVDWPNVQPSVLLDVAGLKIGIVGVMSEDAFSATIAINTRGLQLAELLPSITREAQTLRDSGANLVIVTAHAGSFCEAFDNPLDLSSCNTDGEIMRLASRLPAGLVDQIIGGHVHQGIAHEVNGVAITSSFSNTRAFGRVDYTIDRSNHKIISRRIHPPNPVCGYVDTASGVCATAAAGTPASYEGSLVTPDGAVTAIAARAAELANEVKSERLGVYLETPITRDGRDKSAIGHLFMDALYDSLDGDVIIHNVVGGIRSDLPAGDLIYGSAYEIYPFDNRVTYLELSGADLRKVIAGQVYRDGRRAGFAGMRVLVDCSEGKLDIRMLRTDGTAIEDNEMLSVITTDFLAMGGDRIFTPVLPDGGFSIPTDTPLVRDVFVAWLREQSGSRFSPARLLETENPRWNLAESLQTGCTL